LLAAPNLAPKSIRNQHTTADALCPTTPFLELSSSRAPLLAPSPLRTGLEGFPSSGSSTQKRPPEKRGRGLIQNE
jgi:hypothetical protein